MREMPLVLLALPVLTALLSVGAKNKKTLTQISLAGGGITSGLALWIAYTVFHFGPVSAGGRFIYIDSLSAFVMSLVAVVGLTAALYSVGYMGVEIAENAIPESRLKWFYFWFNIFLFTMFLVVMVANLGVMWVGIEATTLASALLVGFYDKKSALEAAWKYIILCTVGIIFALFGTIILYNAALPVIGEGSRSLDWFYLQEAARQLDPKLVKLAFIFVLVGYGTKVGLAPMHTWLPDAHSQAPSPVSAMLSGVLLNCALYGILRFHQITSHSLASGYSTRLLLIFGVLSIAVALPFIIIQHDLKRLLAYSSIEHMGIIVAAVGLGNRLALYGAFLHMLNHALAKPFLFFSAGNVTQHFHTKKIHKIKGAVLAMPISGTMLLLGAFAIAGAPPFNIFLSEFTIISAGFASGQYLPTSLMLVFITLIFPGMVYAATRVGLGVPPARIEKGEPSKWSATMALIPIIPLFVLGIYIPKSLDQVLQQVVSIFLGGN